MQLIQSVKCKICVGIYVFIERKSKHIGFYVVVLVHFIGISVYNPLSAMYIHRDLVLIYRSRCALYSVVLVAAVVQAL